MMTHGDFVKEGWADHVGVGRCRDSAGEKIDRVGPVGFIEAFRIASKVKFVPKVSGWNSCVFELGEGGFLSVDIVNSKKGRNTEFLGLSGDQTGHPIITMNNVGFNPWDDVIDEVTLKREGGHQKIFLAGLVDSTTSIEFAVFGKVDTVPD